MVPTFVFHKAAQERYDGACFPLDALSQWLTLYQLLYRGVGGSVSSFTSGATVSHIIRQLGSSTKGSVSKPGFESRS